ncbi:MAG: endonuclease/exonuclease/phosphatase family protein [Acidimicrobiia bacterium]
MARPVTVVTWNAQGSNQPDLIAAAAALRALDPDVVLLQEVQRRQLATLAAAMGCEHRWRFKHWGLTLPAEGLGILARGPIEHVGVRALAHRFAFWTWRRRIAVVAVTTVAGRRLAVVDVHLGAGVTHDERVRQVRALIAWARDPVVIAGDLNASPRSAELDVLAAAGWRDAERRTHPDTSPPPTNWPPGARTVPPSQRLDYVLVRDATRVEEAFVPDDWARWARLSDHVPVVARLGGPD